MMTRYEVACMTVRKYDDAPYFIVRSDVIKQTRLHTVMPGRFPTLAAAKKQIKQLENSATT